MAQGKKNISVLFVIFIIVIVFNWYIMYIKSTTGRNSPIYTLLKGVRASQIHSLVKLLQDTPSSWNMWPILIGMSKF